jgi:hypothetical protein
VTGELWSRTRAATYLGMEPESVQRVMSRRGYTPAGRLPGRGRESLWRADDVREYEETRNARRVLRPRR